MAEDVVKSIIAFLDWEIRSNIRKEILKETGRKPTKRNKTQEREREEKEWERERERDRKKEWERER